MTRKSILGFVSLASALSSMVPLMVNVEMAHYGLYMHMLNSLFMPHSNSIFRYTEN